MPGMGRPMTLPPVWAAMALAAGGVGELAAAFEVDRGTVRRWAKGEKTPHAMVQRAVNAWARRRGLEEPWPEEV